MGLGTSITSCLFKMLHRILPYEERLARIVPNCKLCTTPIPVDLLTANSTVIKLVLLEITYWMLSECMIQRPHQ